MQHFDVLIDDFLEGALSGAEKQAFETEVAGNPELAKRLATAKEARERLSRLWSIEASENGLREQLREISADVFKDKQVGPEPRRLQVSRFRWWQLAAAIATILIVCIVAFPSKEQRLYKQMRSFPEADFVSKGANNNPLLQSANKSFNDKAYDKALSAFQAYLKSQPDHQAVQLFAAFCQLELKDYKSAEAAFIALHQSAWADEADWYLALAYLREKDKTRCRNQLLQIKAGNPHFAAAQQLLQEF